jgi:hypothetical protein
VPIASQPVVAPERSGTLAESCACEALGAAPAARIAAAQPNAQPDLILFVMDIGKLPFFPGAVAAADQKSGLAASGIGNSF